MKLTTTTQVSVDGVMQAPGGPQENRKGGFQRGGWAHFDNETATFVGQVYQRADAFLFGRRTYEHFAGSWGTWPDPGDSPIWTALNTRPKYAAPSLGHASLGHIEGRSGRVGVEPQPYAALHPQRAVVAGGVTF